MLLRQQNVVDQTWAAGGCLVSIGPGGTVEAGGCIGREGQHGVPGGLSDPPSFILAKMGALGTGHRGPFHSGFSVGVSSADA